MGLALSPTTPGSYMSWQGWGRGTGRGRGFLLERRLVDVDLCWRHTLLDVRMGGVRRMKGRNLSEAGIAGGGAVLGKVLRTDLGVSVMVRGCVFGD